MSELMEMQSQWEKSSLSEPRMKSPALFFSAIGASKFRYQLSHLSIRFEGYEICGRLKRLQNGQFSLQAHLAIHETGSSINVEF